MVYSGIREPDSRTCKVTSDYSMVDREPSDVKCYKATTTLPETTFYVIIA